MTGYDSKRQMAADKLQEDLINYGTSWSQDGKRIDPMSVYKEPVTEREALKLALEAYLCREMPAGTIIGDPKWWVPKIAAAIHEAFALPAQEPSTITFSASNDWVMRITADRRIEVNKGVEVTETAQKVLEAMQWMLKRAQREWVGLTEEDFSAINQSCLTKLQAATSAESILKERNS